MNFNLPNFNPPNFSFGPAANTELDELVNRATDALRSSPDWAENLEICDVITRGGEAAITDACRALRRRMADRDPKVALLALTLLETCMLNCTEAFHDQVAAKDFQAEVARLAGGKGEVAAKTLALVEAWADAFQSEGHPQFGLTYASLREKGARFPPRDVGSAAPLFTPPPSSLAAPPSAAGGAARPAARGAEDGREAPVFAASLPEAEAEQSADKAQAHAWTFGFMPGYSALPSNDQEHDEEDEADEPRAAGGRGGAADAQAYPGRRAGEWARADARALPVAAAPPEPAPRLPLSDASDLRADLAEVRNSAAVLRECLGAVEPARGSLLEGDEVVRTLLTTLRAVEPRIVALIEGQQAVSEAELELLFSAHAELQAAFAAYDEKLAAVLAEDMGGGLREQARAEAAAAPVDLLNPRGEATGGGRAGPSGGHESTELDELAAVFVATELNAEAGERPVPHAGGGQRAPHAAGAQVAATPSQPAGQHAYPYADAAAATGPGGAQWGGQHEGGFASLQREAARPSPFAAAWETRPASNGEDGRDAPYNPFA